MTIRCGIITVGAMNEERLLRVINRHLKASGESQSAFGLRAVNDSHLVSDLRQGREIRRAVLQRIMLAIAETQRVA